MLWMATHVCAQKDTGEHEYTNTLQSPGRDNQRSQCGIHVSLCFYVCVCAQWVVLRVLSSNGPAENKSVWPLRLCQRCTVCCQGHRSCVSVSPWLRGRALWEAGQRQLHQQRIVSADPLQPHYRTGQYISTGTSHKKIILLVFLSVRERLLILHQRCIFAHSCGLYAYNRSPQMRIMECCCIKGIMSTLLWSSTEADWESVMTLDHTLHLPSTGTYTF